MHCHFDHNIIFLGYKLSSLDFIVCMILLFFLHISSYHVVLVCIQWNTYVIHRVVGRYENLKVASINKKHLNGTSFASILPESGDAPTPLPISNGPETCKGKYGGGHVVCNSIMERLCQPKGGLISEFFSLWLQSSKNMDRN